MARWRQPASAAGPAGAGRWTGFALDALHLVVLANFAVTEPLYVVLGRGAEFFVARRTEPAELLLLVAALGVGLPTTGILLEALAGLVARAARQAVHALLVATCLAAVVLQAIQDVEVLPGDMLVLDAGAAGVALTALYLVWRPARLFVTYLAPASPLFAALFLFATPVSQVLFPTAAQGAAPPVVGQPRPVVVLLFDELNGTLLMDERRRIDAGRYPNLAALAGKATWYRAATTVADSTTEAVPAILTGQRPVSAKRRLPTVKDHPGNIFTLLAHSHRLVAYEPVTRLCPDGLCTRAAATTTVTEAAASLASDLAIVYLHVLLPRDMRATLPSTTRNWTGFADASSHDPAALFGQFVASIERSAQPAVYVAHTLLPHGPWRYVPSGRQYAFPAPLSLAGWELGRREPDVADDEWAVTQELQRHLLQLGLVDRLVGDLVARLETVGLYSETMLVVTADHGLSFRRGVPPRKLTPGNVSDILPVPLLIKYPGQRVGEVRDDNVETVDILPTIADVLGVRIPWAIDGQSLLGPPRAQGEPKGAMSSMTRSVLYVDSRLEARWATLEWMLDRLGSEAEVDGLYRIGPYGALVGRPLAAVEVRAADGRVRVAVADAEAFARVDPAAPVLPLRIAGRVKAPAREPVHLAISVNGVVRAVTRTRGREGGASEFSAMLPEAALRAGRNDVEVLLVSGPPRHPSLHRIEREGP